MQNFDESEKEMKAILFVLTFSLNAHAESHKVCFKVCTPELKRCELLRAIAVDGQIEGLNVPSGKIVIHEIKCPNRIH